VHKYIAANCCVLGQNTYKHDSAINQLIEIVIGPKLQNHTITIEICTTKGNM
jgi:hypothetical protein